jgi:hypothetical protein
MHQGVLLLSRHSATLAANSRTPPLAAKRLVWSDALAENAKSAHSDSSLKSLRSSLNRCNVCESRRSSASRSNMAAVFFVGHIELLWKQWLGCFSRQSVLLFRQITL